MKLTEAITVFLEDQGSANTARTYSCGLRRFMEWSPTSIEGVEDLDPKQAIPFARSLKKEGLSSRSVGAYLTALVQFLRWLKRERVSDISAEDLLMLQEQVKDWNKKHKTKKLPRLPKENAVMATLATAHKDNLDDERQHLLALRNAALLETWASTACRISESAHLKRSDLEDNMTAWVRRGKGRDDRMIVFDSKESWDAVQMYLAARDKMNFVVMEDEEPLFSRHDKATHGRGEIHSLTPNGMREALKALCKQAGKGYFTPHGFRHRAATDLLNKTGNLAMVQKFLGHADIGTTANTYIHLTNDDLIKALRGTT